MTESPPSDDPLDEAFAAYLRSCDAGEIGSREEFLSQFPDLADDLKELMKAADMITGMTHVGPAVASETPAVAGGAETINTFVSLADDSGLDPAATLPMANRRKGDPGPTLPYSLGDYELLEVIGRGGMGVVYLARQNHLDRMVAVKMIRSGMLASEEEVRRFYTEAQAAARLHHPGIVAVHQFGQRANHHFFSMEYIKGRDLQKRINGELLDPMLAARYVRDVALAIDHAHQKEVLHRDLKPANVLIDEEDQIHITDFGLAKNLDADSSVTGSGAAVGTPHYMAPEQAGGYSDRASKQSDVYSIGAILFACLAGRPPIVGDTVVQTLMQVVHNPAPPVRSIRPDAPADLETIIAKCLEKSPGKRYQSAGELANELDAFLKGKPISARPRSRAARTWQWLEGVPVIGALLGRDVVETSTSHRRFQAGVLCLLMLTPLGFFGASQVYDRYANAIPASVTFGGGLDGGVYTTVSTEIAARLKASSKVATDVKPSGGSFDNQAMLLAGDIDLAPMQASAVSGDDLCVVAPLFYEAVHVVVQKDRGIDSVEDLRGKDVAVGPQGSGSHRTAALVFESLKLTDQIQRHEVGGWSELFEKNAPSAAIICIGRGSQLITDLLVSGRWKIVPIPPTGIQTALQHPTLRPMNIGINDYVDEKNGSQGFNIAGPIATVGTTAFLVARKDTPRELVKAVLETLYDPPTLFPSMISRRHASEWTDLVFHPAARHFYEREQ